jgi:hypothetical protein
MTDTAQTDFELGGTETLSVTRNSIANHQNRINQLVAEAYITVVRMYCIHRVVHCDGHGGNFMATKNTNGTYKVTVIDLHEVIKLVVGEQYYAEGFYKQLLEADPKGILPAITDIIERVKYFANTYRKNKYGDNITDGFSWMHKDTPKNTEEQLLMAAVKIRSTEYRPRALPFGSLKIKRPNIEPVSAKSLPDKRDREPSSDEYVSDKRQKYSSSASSSSSSYASSSDGGKSKRTRRAKPKKRRTIKRRNALKR